MKNLFSWRRAFVSLQIEFMPNTEKPISKCRESRFFFRLVFPRAPASETKHTRSNDIMARSPAWGSSPLPADPSLEPSSVEVQLFQGVSLIGRIFSMNFSVCCGFHVMPRRMTRAGFPAMAQCSSENDLAITE